MMKIKPVLFEYFKWFDKLIEEELPKSPIFENSDHYFMLETLLMDGSGGNQLKRTSYMISEKLRRS
jgi:hypothetical protein